jgi:hypothetical protein
MNTQFPLSLYGGGRNKNCDLICIQMIKIPPLPIKWGIIDQWKDLHFEQWCVFVTNNW